MTISIDITGLPSERIVFAPSPLAELASALHVLAEPGHHPGMHAWATATRAGLEPELADKLHQADFLWLTIRADFLMPAEPKDTLKEELDALDGISDEQFVQAATVARGGEDAPSPLTDAAERRAVRAWAAARGPRQAEFVDELMNDPPAVRAWIRRLLEECDRAFFDELWQRVRFPLVADARDKTEILRHKGLADALAAVSSSLTLEEGGGDGDDGSDGGGRRRDGKGGRGDRDGRGDRGGSTRIAVDKLHNSRTTALDTGQPGGPGVTLIPSAVGWPHLYAVHEPGWRPTLLYPVRPPQPVPPVPLTVMLRRLEAVAHPDRVRICRTIASAPNTTTELTAATGMSAPQVSRHLTVLKKAGLLVTRRRGRYAQHRLDLTVAARLGSDFLEGILR